MSCGVLNCELKGKLRTEHFCLLFMRIQALFKFEFVGKGRGDDNINLIQLRSARVYLFYTKNEFKSTQSKLSKI